MIYLSDDFLLLTYYMEISEIAFRLEALFGKHAQLITSTRNRKIVEKIIVASSNVSVKFETNNL